MSDDDCGRCGGLLNVHGYGGVTDDNGPVCIRCLHPWFYAGHRDDEAELQDWLRARNPAAAEPHWRGWVTLTLWNNEWEEIVKLLRDAPGGGRILADWLDGKLAQARS